MGRRKATALAAAVLCGLLVPVTVRAQQPQIPERCLAQPQRKPELKLSIDSLVLEGAPLPSGFSHARFVAMLEQRAGSGGAGWLNRVRTAARDQWRDRGHFQTVVNVQTVEDSVQAGVRHVSLRIRVDPGPQFRVAKVRILNVNPGGKLVFSNQRLRELIPLHPGELVNVRKARQGLEAIKELYASHGYIDLQATPSFQIDAGEYLISLLVMLDQGRQYRVGKIVVLGFGPSQQALLNSKIKSGDVFDWNVVQNFYSSYQWLMPAGASVSDDRIIRDAKNSTVDLLLDFRACPKPAGQGSHGESAVRDQASPQQQNGPQGAGPLN